MGTPKRKCRISIDPGITGTGYAIWSEKNWKRKVRPFRTGNLFVANHKRGEAWQTRAKIIANKVSTLLSDYRPLIVYCEHPRIFMGSAVGLAAAAKGDIIKLSYLCGMFDFCAATYGIPTVSVPVNDWKGTMSKEAVSRRIERRINMIYLDHACDAVGIGLWAKGFFDPIKKGKHSGKG